MGLLKATDVPDSKKSYLVDSKGLAREHRICVCPITYTLWPKLPTTWSIAHTVLKCGHWFVL